MMDRVRLESEKGFAYVGLDRPEKKIALDTSMFDALRFGANQIEAVMARVKKRTPAFGSPMPRSPRILRCARGAPHRPSGSSQENPA